MCLCAYVTLSICQSRAQRLYRKRQGRLLWPRACLSGAGGLIQRVDPRTPPAAECILTHAAHAAGIQLKILRAVAEVAAGGVDTQAVDAVHRVCTLIHICGVGAASAEILPLSTHFPPAFFLGSRIPGCWGLVLRTRPLGRKPDGTVACPRQPPAFLCSFLLGLEICLCQQSPRANIQKPILRTCFKLGAGRLQLVGQIRPPICLCK